MPGIEEELATAFGMDAGNDQSAMDTSNDSDVEERDGADYADQDAGDDQQQQQMQQQTQDDDEENPQLTDEERQVLQEKPQRDANGNIIDKNGNIVAQKGAESRVFHQNNRLRQALNAADRRNQQLAGQLAEFKYIAELPTKLNLAPQQAAEALNFRAKFESDPVSAVREVVARVLGLGYSMDQLFGEDARDFINGRALDAALERRLGPLEKRTREDAARDQRNAAAKEAYDHFIATHEYADVHGDAIARLVGEQNISPELAYSRLETFAAKNGLDFTQPLGPQIAQRQQRGGPQQRQQPQQRGAPQQQPGRRPQRPLAPGRVPATNGVTPAGNTAMAPANATWEEIIRNTMHLVGSNARN